ncbi:unnamed protein product, partial [Polarella glacialis]
MEVLDNGAHASGSLSSSGLDHSEPSLRIPFVAFSADGLVHRSCICGPAALDKAAFVPHHEKTTAGPMWPDDALASGNNMEVDLLAICSTSVGGLRGTVALDKTTLVHHHEKTTAGPMRPDGALASGNDMEEDLLAFCSTSIGGLWGPTTLDKADKDIRDVGRILVSLKKAGQGRREPLL